MSSENETYKPQGEIPAAFTGEYFTARARNHYEENDGIPHAPPVDYPRPSVRQRVENLLNRNIDVLVNYVGHEGADMDIPDDPDADLTPSEQNYVDSLAEALAEASPLPDEGMPRSEVQIAPEPPGAPPEGLPAVPPAPAAPKAP